MPDCPTTPPCPAARRGRAPAAMLLRLSAALAAALGATAAVAQPAQSLPPAVLDHVEQLDKRCAAAGGRPAGGRFVIAQDFTGDGRTDFLVSEGDYACAGRADMFRRGGVARVAIYVGEGGGARRVFFETLAAYRVLAGAPARVQVAKRGSACGAGTPANGLCGGTLAWTGRAFALPGAAATAEKPQTAPAMPSAAPPAAASAAPPPAPSSAPSPGPGTAPAARAAAAGPATSASLADLLLAVLPEQAGVRPTADALRQSAAGVRWAGKPPARALAQGTYGGVQVEILGRAQPEQVLVNWSKVGVPVTFDVPDAMRKRGATLVQASCEKLGVGEGQRVYAGTMPGRAPFTLTIEVRDAPTASATSYYSATVGLDGRHPPKGAAAGCDF